jgi:hypothetical protein
MVFSHLAAASKTAPYGRQPPPRIPRHSRNFRPQVNDAKSECLEYTEKKGWEVLMTAGKVLGKKCGGFALIKLVVPAPSQPTAFSHQRPNYEN